VSVLRLFELKLFLRENTNSLVIFLYFTFIIVLY